MRPPIFEQWISLSVEHARQIDASTRWAVVENLNAIEYDSTGRVIGVDRVTSWTASQVAFSPSDVYQAAGVSIPSWQNPELAQLSRDEIFTRRKKEQENQTYVATQHNHPTLSWKRALLAMSAADKATFREMEGVHIISLLSAITGETIIKAFTADGEVRINNAKAVAIDEMWHMREIHNNKEVEVHSMQAQDEQTREQVSNILTSNNIPQRLKYDLIETLTSPWAMN